MIRRIQCTAAVLLFAASLTLAQGGGKAEPRRIEFKRATNSTTVGGQVKDDQEMEYVLAAKKGQRLSIKLTSVPAKATVFDLKAPGDADLGLEYDANWSFNKVLPVTGDYLIIVARPTSEKGQASFKLLITVR
jgi:hypothetical protein